MTARDIRLRTMLSWAVDFVKHEVACWEQTYSGPDGTIDDADVPDHVRDARRWLAEAKRELAVRR